MLCILEILGELQSMVDYKKIKEDVKNFGLKPATQRELPLITLSCIGKGYTQLLRELFGIAYNGIIAIGSKNKFHTLLNENHISEEVKKIAGLEKIQKEILPIAKSIYEETKINLELLRYLSEKDTLEFFKRLIILYPRYLASIGIYNCFWRFIGNDSNILPQELINQISSEREQIARIYPEIENLMRGAFKNHEQKYKLQGELLSSMTLLEMEGYLETLTVSEEQIKILKSRMKGYIFYLIDKNEEVIHDEELVKFFKEEFIIIREEINQIKGYSASGGNVRGMAYNLENSKKINELENVIIVKSMTSPEDLSLMEKSLAIITDEGGILSHAAIVSREMGVPCVVGTEIATRTINTGDFLEVDATKGLIKILAKVR